MNYFQGHSSSHTVELTDDRIRQLAPSAFAERPYSGQSNRYAFVPTSAVIQGMREAGFVPVSAIQSRTRIAEKTDFTKHMIRFRQLSSLTQTAVVGESVVEAVMVNSHDGSSTYDMMAGLWRWVCCNGMMVADSLLESVKIRHTGRVIEDVIEGSQHIFEHAPKVLDAVREWQGITLDLPEQKLLAAEAHSLRFPVDEETGKSSTTVTPEMLLSPRRSDDSGSDLWHTFNRIQENATKPIPKWSRIARNADGPRGQSRGIRSIDGDVRINRALWSLTEKFAELKRAN